MVNLPVISPFKKRYSWVQLAGHTGERCNFRSFGSGTRRMSGSSLISNLPEASVGLNGDFVQRLFLLVMVG